MFPFPSLVPTLFYYKRFFQTKQCNPNFFPSKPCTRVNRNWHRGDSLPRKCYFLHLFPGADNLITFKKVDCYWRIFLVSPCKWTPHTSIGSKIAVFHQCNSNCNIIPSSGEVPGLHIQQYPGLHRSYTTAAMCTSEKIENVFQFSHFVKFSFVLWTHYYCRLWTSCVVPFTTNFPFILLFVCYFNIVFIMKQGIYFCWVLV